MEGFIKSIDTSRGFGFIRQEGTSSDFFFHRSACPDFDTLTCQQRVSFDREPSDKGPRACDVRPAS